MTFVVTFGCWDLLHVGHVAFLERAAALGDRLVVGVPSDEVVCEDKGREPVITMADRVRMLQALRCVSVAVPYFSLDFLPVLEAVRPDVLAVGDTWGTAERHLAAERWMREGRVVRLPHTSGVSTTIIRGRMR